MCRARISDRSAAGALLGLALAVAFGLAPTPEATAQRLRASMGCDKIEELPKDISLAELEKRCFGDTTAAPAAPPPVIATPPTNATAPQPAIPSPPPVVAPPVQPPPVIVTAAPPPPEKRFTVIEGLDIDGQDFDRRANVELRECLVACRDEQRCSAFAYDKWNRMCFLKHTNPGVFRREPKAIVAINSTAHPSFDSSRATFLQKYRGMIFHDPGFETFRANTYEQCSDACDRQNKCEVFTYFTQTRQCKLISRPGEPFRNQSNVISGVKRQQPLN